VDAKPKVLVALIGQTRATELTADSFRANLLDALGADLALCVRAGEPPNPFHEWAKYVWTFEESGDWAAHYDEAAGNSDWRVLLEVGELMLGGIEDEKHPQKTSVAVLYYYRRLLWRKLRRTGLDRAYDWIVLTRSDLTWPAPHPDVRLLSDRRIYVLDGEQYGGVCDRHLVVPRRYFEPVLGGLVEPVFSDPRGLKRRIDSVVAREGWFLFNIERLLAMRLREAGLWRRVRYLPYVPFAVRAPGGPTAWSAGEFDEELGCYVKYPTETERSEIALDLLGDPPAWERYLSPLRGAGLRRRLRAAYRERGLYERAFRRRDPAVRALRRAARALEAAGSPFRRAAASLRALEPRVGRQLRRAPGMPALLDARLRRIRRRAEARPG
jgi:hypothetical protein